MKDFSDEALGNANLTVFFFLSVPYYFVKCSDLPFPKPFSTGKAVKWFCLFFFYGRMKPSEDLQMTLLGVPSELLQGHSGWKVRTAGRACCVVL